LDREGRDTLSGAAVLEGERPVLGLTPARYEDGQISLRAVRLGDQGARSHDIRAIGPGPNGALTELAVVPLAFEAGSAEATVDLALPPELRNRVTRFEIAEQRSAGAVSLTDDSLARRQVALLTAAEDESQDLLSPLYYLRRALEPTADLIEGDLATILPATPDVLIFADVARLSPSEADDVTTWVEEGGLLLRFAGPNLAGSDLSRDFEDALMPVRLRTGGRTVGGALSWGEPKELRPFAAESPFFGLTVPDDVSVSSQVMAQPDPTLADRAIAALADGTPLVTRKSVGQGQVVLFHVTANAEWSSLPLSGLFVQMLERLAVSTRPAAPTEEDLAGTTWSPRIIIDGFGTVRDAGTLPGVPGEELVSPVPGPDVPPGVYEGPTQSLAINVLAPDTELAPATWPVGTRIEGFTGAEETDLMPYLLALAMALLTIDILASLWLGGRLRRNTAPLTVALFAAALALPSDLRAQDSPVPTEVSLAYVMTGDRRVDDTSQAGLQGLSNVLTARTSIEPVPPSGVDLELDELAFFPLLYWPVVPEQPIPSSDAYAKLNRYLRGGGMIVFDTRDA
ncbi:MAG: DUF4159 domain-containing protein, partial [Pseudomonadota bacterium]